MLGVVIGVSSVITMVALGTGAEQAVRVSCDRAFRPVVPMSNKRRPFKKG